MTNLKALAREVRLDPQERTRLSALFRRYLLRMYPDAVVYLFGSRTDPGQRGGDLDLLVVSPAAARDAYALRKALRIAITEQLGDQKVDIVVSPGAEDGEQAAFIRLALREGVQIWP